MDGIPFSSRRRNVLFDSVHHERWDDVTALLKKRSGRSMARRLGQDDLTPLHMAVWLGGVPEPVLRALLSAHADACKRRDNAWGFTPLHMACYSHRSTVQTVRHLVETCPKACAVRDKQKLTPLHRACLMASEDILGIVRVLLHADPSQVNVEIRNGRRDVPFHLSVARIHHEIQKERFEPLRPASHWHEFRGPHGEGGGNIFPYHDHHEQLSQLIDATFLILEAEDTASIGTGHLSESRKFALLNQCVKRSKCPNHRLFVYMALWEYPGLATMEDPSTGNLMLHVASDCAKHDIGDCHWCAGCNRGLADPHFVSQDSGESCDLTCAYRSIEEGEQSWYRKYKDRLYKDVVLTMPYGCILKQMAKIYPQAASTKNSAGKLSLHVAIANGHTWIPGVEAIFDAYPAAIKVRDVDTGLFPFMLAAVQKPGPPGDENWGRKRHLSELTTCFELLRQDPTLINGGGRS